MSLDKAIKHGKEQQQFEEDIAEAKALGHKTMRSQVFYTQNKSYQRMLDRVIVSAYIEAAQEGPKTSNIWEREE